MRESSHKFTTETPTSKSPYKIIGVLIAVLTLVFSFGVPQEYSPVAAMSPPNTATVPATGDFDVPGCVGTVSSPQGEIITFDSFRLKGTSAQALRDGKAVFLYDNRGDVILDKTSVSARLPYCGALLDAATNTVTVDWRFCTNMTLGGCATNLPSVTPQNPALDDDQVAAIAALLQYGTADTKRERSILQIQIWCVSDYGYEWDEEPNPGTLVRPGNVNYYALDYANSYWFRGNANSSDESRPLTPAEATCDEWPVVPDDAELEIDALNSPINAGENAEFNVAVNFSGQVELRATPSGTPALCPTSQNNVTLDGSTLRFSKPGTAKICVQGSSGGQLALTGTSETIPHPGTITWLWNGSRGCQVFADFSNGQNVTISDSAVVTVNSLVPGYSHAKTSQPAHNTEVFPNDRITYTLTGVNSGQTNLDVVLTDDLSGVLDFATYQDDAVAQVGATAVNDPVFDANAKTITWTGVLAPGETVAVTYSVIVNTGVSGKLIANKLSSTATPPGEPPITPPDVEVEHPVPTPGFSLIKTAIPPEYSEVLPGDTITYSITGTNTGQTVLDPVEIFDDLTDVLEFATLDESSLTSVIGDTTNTNPPVATTAPVVAGTNLSWQGVLDPDEYVIISYSVEVNEGVGGVLLHNVATGTAKPPGEDPIVPPPTDVEHPVPQPGFAIEKISDPVSGTEVSPGDTLTYYLTGTNTGQTVLDPVTLTDDLTHAVQYLTYNGDAVAVTSMGSAGTLSFNDGTNELLWVGSLEPGEVVTISLSGTVDADAVGQTINNRLHGEATPPGSPPIVPPDEETEHPVPTPGFEIGKTATPGDGAEVNPGDQLTYRVTGSNTGETVLDPVIITDNFSDITGYATYNNDVFATIDGTSSAGTITFDRETGLVSWWGALNPNETVTITYSFTVLEDALGEVIDNIVSGAATPPGTPPITPPDEETRHPVPTPGFEIAKASDPVPGTKVNPGEEITFSISGENTGETVLDPVILTDDLTGVLAWAALDEESIVADVSGTQVQGVAYDADAATLVWTGALQPTQKVTVSYTVTVNVGSEGELIENVLTGTGKPPGLPPISPPERETQHPVPTPGFELVKESDPESGTTVQAGQVVTYTVTATNTGEVVLDPVIVNDDLSEVLSNASFVEGTENAKISGADSGDLVLEGTDLQWTGVLQPKEAVVISYQVKISTVESATFIKNVASAVATPPAGEDLVPPDVSTEHPLLVGDEEPLDSNQDSAPDTDKQLPVTGQKIALAALLSIVFLTGGFVLNQIKMNALAVRKRNR